MKLILTPFRHLVRIFPRSVLVLFCWALAATSSIAATVVWSGAGGDDQWSNPANWSGSIPPAPGDNVIIDVPGNATVRMDLPNTTVGSLQCEEAFIIEKGPFAVTNGVSVINGAFNVKPGNTLRVAGASTVFTVHGVVTNLWTVQAENGAIVSIPGAGELTLKQGFPYAEWSASGAGSAILLTNLTQLAIEAGYWLGMYAHSGGRIEVPRLATPQGSLQVSAQGDDSWIDLSGFNGLWSQGFNGGSGCSLSAGRGATVTLPNVTAMDQVSLILNDDANVTLNQLHSFSNANMNLSRRTNGFPGLTNFSGSLWASETRLDWTNIVDFQTTGADVRIAAYNNSVLDLSRVTNVVMKGNFRLYLTAQSDSQLDLRRLPQPDGVVIVESRLGGGLVNLSSFEGLWEGMGSSVWAADESTVLIPNVTALRNVSLNLDSNSYIPTAQIRSIVEGSLTLRDRTNGFDSLTNFSASLSVTRTRLDLTNITVIYATNGYVDIGAYQGSFVDLSRVTNLVTGAGYRLYATAYGGYIDLSGLTLANAGVSALAGGPDSHVDLSGLHGEWIPDIGAGNLTVMDGGTLSIPNITAMRGVSLSVSGNPGLDLSRIESMVDASLSFTSCTNSLDALTRFGGSLAVNDARLNLTNLTAVYLTNRNNYFWVAERGGVLNLSNVTTFVRASGSGSVSLDASRDGHIDLRSLTDPGGSLSINVAGVRGLVDLSGLSGLWNQGGSVIVNQGGALRIPNVTAMDGISLSVNGGQVSLSQLESFANGSFNLSYQTNTFSALTHFSGSMSVNTSSRAEFPALAQLLATNGSIHFGAGFGGQIDLAAVTNAIVKTYSLSLQASAGGHIDIPNMETMVAGYVDVAAHGADAVVDLSGLTGFFSDNNGGRFSTSAGGVILLNPDAMLIAGAAFDLQSNPGGPVPPFLAPSQSLVLYGQPWRSYRIESRNPSVANSPWSLYRRVALTEPLEMVGTFPPKDLLLRVRVFVADPPEVDIRVSGPGTVAPVLFGVPGRIYRLETSTALESGGWEEGATTTLTNSFFIFPSTAATNHARFYRGRQL